MSGDWLQQASEWVAKAIGVLSAEAWLALLKRGLEAIPIIAIGLWAWKGFIKWQAPYKAPLPLPKYFNILIADLANDRRHFRRQQLCKTLDEWSLRQGIPLQVYALRRRIESRDFLGDEGRKRVAIEAQSWLNETGYDVLVWGTWLEAAGAYPSYNLRFAARNFGYREAAKLEIPAFVAYVLKEMNVLVSPPDGLQKDIGAVIAEAASQFLVAAGNLENDLNKEVLSKALKRAIEVLSVHASLLSDASRAALRDQVWLSLSESIRDLPRELVQQFRSWIQDQVVNSDASEDIYWRIVRNTLELDTAINTTNPVPIIGVIVEKRRTLVKDIDRSASPTQWGLAQYELGQALTALGDHSGNQDYNFQAVEALRGGLAEVLHLPEAREHALWLLGKTLRQIGTESTSEDFLQCAAATLEQAAQCDTRRRKIMRYRILQELGHVYGVIGTRTNEKTYLDRAIAIFELAVGEFKAGSLSKSWVRLQYDYGIVLLYRGHHDGGKSYLEQAKSKFLYGLDQHDKEADLSHWAAAMSSLANTYNCIGRWTGSSSAFASAIDAYRAAIEAIPKDSEAHWSLVRENFGDCLRVVAKVTGNSAYYDEGERVLRAAVDAQKRDVRSLRWVRGQLALGHLLLDAGERAHDLLRVQEAKSICETVLDSLSKLDNASIRDRGVDLLAQCHNVLEKAQRSNPL